jgi:hypothetical protein
MHADFNTVRVRHAWRRMATASLFAIGLGLSSAAMAQAPAPQGQPAQGQSQTQQSDIPDQKLDQAAAALEKVSNLKRDYEQKISSAPAAEQEKIASEANTELTKAVTDQGLSVEEYNTIIQVAQNDPQVRQKILSRVKVR